MRTPKIYAGIGARKTPNKIREMMFELGMTYASLGDTLRSGGAEGADSSFERGHRAINHQNAEIYIPWNGFNNRDCSTDKCIRYGVCTEALILARKYHPNWEALGNGARKLHARNVYQILGHDLQTPADLVICWTPKGEITGGTGQAIRIAQDYKIPVANLAIKKHYNLFQKITTKFKFECNKTLKQHATI